MTGHRIITRAEWGARHDDGAGPAPIPASEIWLHHSTTIAPDLEPPFDDDYAAVRQLEQIGEQRFGRGISYSFLVTPVGLVFEGHSIGRKGSHTAGRNSVARAICLIGNYEASRPTEQQLDAVAWLLVHGWLAGWWQPVELTGGHRDVKATACPGRHAYALLPEMNRRAKALANALLTPGRKDTLDVDGATLEKHVDAAVRRVLNDKTAGRPFALDRLTHAHNYAKGASLNSAAILAQLATVEATVKALANAVAAGTGIDPEVLFAQQKRAAVEAIEEAFGRLDVQVSLVAEDPAG